MNIRFDFVGLIGVFIQAPLQWKMGSSNWQGTRQQISLPWDIWYFSPIDEDDGLLLFSLLLYYPR